mmetsp:Transcript_110118/g.355420  ORF Transcript_110118/g.355420 Transcript_110118/m.355420 type:complete len:285 (+) Transcript_110118:756-1610(+)
MPKRAWRRWSGLWSSSRGSWQRVVPATSGASSCSSWAAGQTKCDGARAARRFCARPPSSALGPWHPWRSSWRWPRQGPSWRSMHARPAGTPSASSCPSPLARPRRQASRRRKAPCTAASPSGPWPGAVRWTLCRCQRWPQQQAAVARLAAAALAAPKAAQRRPLLGPDRQRRRRSSAWVLMVALASTWRQPAGATSSKRSPMTPGSRTSRLATSSSPSRGRPCTAWKTRRSWTGASAGASARVWSSLSCRRNTRVRYWLQTKPVRRRQHLRRSRPRLRQGRRSV